MGNKSNHRQTLGKRGENLACRFLQESGHLILERNWRSGHFEIDLITQDPDGIHFVEVKSRQKNIQAPPQVNVNAAKQRNITAGALRYLNSQRGAVHRSLECFFDVIAITFNEGIDESVATIEWVPHAYIPLYI